MVCGKESFASVIEELVHVLVLALAFVTLFFAHHVCRVHVGVHVVHKTVVADLGVGVNSSEVIV